MGDLSGNKWSGLIYDVGMHLGDDTAFYLSQGYKVVGIEANPDIAEATQKRFCEQVRSGQLTVLNVGIAETSGTADFWICDENSTWNSFHRKIASREGMQHHAIQIPTRRFGEIVEDHGVPVYLKIDIEGSDHLCVQDLIGKPLPRFISLECECTGDNEELSEADSLKTLNLLYEAGYRRFKLIRQDHIAAEPYSDFAQFVQRVVYAAAYGRLRAPGVSQLGELLTSEGRLKRKYRSRTAVEVRPWGDEMPGPWLDFSAAKALHMKARQRHFRKAGAKKYTFWYDWHAAV